MSSPRLDKLQKQEVLSGKKVVYTKTRIVYLRALDVGGKGPSDEVVYNIPPNTPVRVDGELTAKLLQAGIPFVSVTVEGTKITGVIPKSVLMDYALSEYHPALTGVTYGGYKWRLDDSGSRIQSFKGTGGHCCYCNLNANTHKIYETDWLRKELQDFITELPNIRNDFKTIQIPQRKMFGLLATVGDNTRYVALSGADNEAFQQAVLKYNQRKGKQWVVARALRDDDKHLNGKFEDTLKFVRSLSNNSEFKMSQLQCAAPKLIQEAFRANAKPYAMTEIFYNETGSKPAKSEKRLEAENYAHNVTAESCPLCRMAMPYMMCYIGAIREQVYFL